MPFFGFMAPIAFVALFAFMASMPFLLVLRHLHLLLHRLLDDPLQLLLQDPDPRRQGVDHTITHIVYIYIYIYIHTYYVHERESLRGRSPSRPDEAPQAW